MSMKCAIILSLTLLICFVSSAPMEHTSSLSEEKQTNIVSEELGSEIKVIILLFSRAIFINVNDILIYPLMIFTVQKKEIHMVMLQCGSGTCSNSAISGETNQSHLTQAQHQDRGVKKD